LKYTLNKNIFKNYRRISKPGSRVYATAAELYRYYSEKPFIVVSTTKGLVSHRYAISKNLGGEVLFELSYF
jgi:small subunit ribosomal protein S8